jgi:hypothetical protein
MANRLPRTALSDGRGEQLPEVAVYLLHVAGLEGEETEMPGDALDHPELAIRDQRLLGGAVANGDEHVLVYGHHEGLGLHAAQSRREVAAGVATSRRRAATSRPS